MFIRKWVYRSAWVFVIVFFNLLQLMADPTGPVRANPFEDYRAYMPGQDVQPLLKDQTCYFTFSMPYNHKRIVECYMQNEVVESILISVNDDNSISNIYFYLEQCAVKAGDLMLWYAVEMKPSRHGTRRIVWDGGKASSGTATATVWTPNACVWGIWFDGDDAQAAPEI